MSAKNWATCPKCKKRFELDQEGKYAAAEAAYGKVPAWEYQQKLRAAEVAAADSPDLREDYEIGVGANGLFFVSYSCHCRACGFKHKFKHEEQLKTD